MVSWASSALNAGSVVGDLYFKTLGKLDFDVIGAVSYTHLTLPTILLV